LRWILLILCLLGTGAVGTWAEETSDSLKVPDSLVVIKIGFDTIYVIPAGPLAGSFTDASRLQVVDTVAGWAKILVEGWVPVDKVVARMTSGTGQITLTEIEKPKKQKPERPQCIAMTGKGKQCTRKAMAGSKRCWQHSQ
jgi:hypothetical protein